MNNNVIMATLEIETTNMTQLSKFIEWGTQKFNFDIRVVNYEQTEDFQENKLYFEETLEKINNGKIGIISDADYKKQMKEFNEKLWK